MGGHRRLGATYRREVTPDHVGRRVSIRRWVEDDDRGMVPSDVVGTLVSWDADTLVVQRRTGQQVEIGAADVLASRLVPEQPPRPGRPSLPA